MIKKLTISALLTGMVCGASAQSLKPVLESVECGQMLFKTPSTYTITLRNATSTATQIKSVETGCGCTVANYYKGDIAAGQETSINLTFDAKQLGHFERTILIYDTTSGTPAEVTMRGQIVTKVENYSGDYPFKMGNLLTDVEDLEFDNVNKGQRFVREIHIMNPTGQNVQPVALRLPSYLRAEMKPEVIGPKQHGTMYITLNSQSLRDYGLAQTSFYIGQSASDKISEDKEISVSTVLLPPAVAKDDVSRPYSAKLQMSSNELDMTALARKAKAKDEITITNNGRSDLEISKLQLFTLGLQVQLGKSRLAPGESTKLKVTAVAKDLKKARTRPRILMITNDPDNQKVIITIKR